MSKCFNPDCNNQTNNPKYCSRSCAATHNGKLYPKRKPENKCVDCDKPIRTSQKRCRECANLKKFIYTTLAELPRKDAGRYSPVRVRAVTLYKKSGKPQVCFACGYNKHIEICHIKSIASYPPDTLLDVVNDINNLVALCPNCHWELDNNLLSI